MWSCRRVLWGTFTAVLLVAISLPAITLYHHWTSATALESRTAFGLTYEEPLLGQWMNREWYTKLFGTVPHVYLGNTASIADAMHLRHLRGFNSLAFDGCSDEVWIKLPTHLTGINFLQNNVPPSPVAWAQIGRMQRLEFLSIDGFQRDPTLAPPNVTNKQHWSIDAAFVKAVANKPRLKDVALTYVDIPHPILREFLAQTPQLEILDLSGVRILNEADLALLHQHGTIQSLSLNDNRSLTVGCIEQIAKIKSLKTFAAEGLRSDLSSRLKGLRPDVEIEN